MAIAEESNGMLFQKQVEIKDLARRINAEVEQFYYPLNMLSSQTYNTCLYSITMIYLLA